jgi:hypothetical protein
MCMTLSPLVGLRKWNWDGDRIVHECIVPSGRPAIGHTGPRYEYPIDVREFLVTGRNEVLGRTLREDLVAFAGKRGLRPELLRSRGEGTFDLRAAAIAAFVSDRVAYRPVRGVDYWQFPDETLFLGAGDCEDRALLIAALLIASGVSSFNVRVALGKVRIRASRRKEQERDHAWVVYKNEAGRWQVLEPLVARRYETRRKTKVRLQGLPRDVHRAEYVPYYLFNDVHLWQVAHTRKLPSLGTMASLRREWSRLEPEFAGEVHRSILTQALSIPECPAWFLQSVTSHFSTIFGQVIDEQDNFLGHGYDCRDHFDNGFIEEGWKLVQERLAVFRADNPLHVDAFAGAAHAIADFYAHSSYAHFADQGTHAIPIYDEDEPLGGLDEPPAYEGNDFDLAAGPFTTGPSWKDGKPAAAAAWKGAILSGRYAQRGDSRAFIEALCPTPRDLEKPGDRAALPHHDEIAVDGNGSSNRLYSPVGEYHRQFVMRQGAAVEHIRKAFRENWTGP